MNSRVDKYQELILHRSHDSSNRNGTFSIDSQNSFYDPMAYTFFHPFGTPGWFFKVNNAITPMWYYCFLLHTHDLNNTIVKDYFLHASKLTMQYAIDMYMKTEEHRLRYIRSHQDDMKVALYNGLQDAHLNDNTADEVGVKIILPILLFK